MAEEEKQIDELVALVKSAAIKVEFECKDMVDLLMRCSPLGRMGRQPHTIPANHETLMARVVFIAKRCVW